MGFGKSVTTAEAEYLLGKDWTELIHFWIKKDNLTLLQGKRGEDERVKIRNWIEYKFSTDTPEPERCNRQRIFFCRKVCQSWHTRLQKQKIQSQSISADLSTIL